MMKKYMEASDPILVIGFGPRVMRVAGLSASLLTAPMTVCSTSVVALDASFRALPHFFTRRWRSNRIPNALTMPSG